MGRRKCHTIPPGRVKGIFFFHSTLHPILAFEQDSRPFAANYTRYFIKTGSKRSASM